VCHAGRGEEGKELVEFEEIVLERARNIILSRISSGSCSSIAPRCRWEQCEQCRQQLGYNIRAYFGSDDLSRATTLIVSIL
jgi:hypothetical protein